MSSKVKCGAGKWFSNVVVAKEEKVWLSESPCTYVQWIVQQNSLIGSTVICFRSAIHFRVLGF